VFPGQRFHRKWWNSTSLLFPALVCVLEMIFKKEKQMFFFELKSSFPLFFQEPQRNLSPDS